MSLPKHAIFTQHSRSWQTNRYVYPVISRRSQGLSIGINVNRDKACNFDCVYCCVDRSGRRTDEPGTDGGTVDLQLLGAELDMMLESATIEQLFTLAPFDQTPADLRRLNDVALSGDGEPTLCPQLAEVCQLVARLLRKHRQPEVKIVLITNATLLHRPAVARTLAFLDQHHGEIWAKLDAGTESYYRKIERTRVPFSRVLANIASAGRDRPIVIQSLFMRLSGRASPPGEIHAYVARLRELMAQGCQIKLVQAYTVARGTADSTVTALDDQSLDAIADRIRVLGLPVETYYGPGGKKVIGDR